MEQILKTQLIQPISFSCSSCQAVTCFFPRVTIIDTFTACFFSSYKDLSVFLDRVHYIPTDSTSVVFPFQFFYRLNKPHTGQCLLLFTAFVLSQTNRHHTWCTDNEVRKIIIMFTKLPLTASSILFSVNLAAPLITRTG